MGVRKDDRDAKKSYEQDATEDPIEAQKDSSVQQAAELQVGEEGERQDRSRFEPDPKAKLQYTAHNPNPDKSESKNDIPDSDDELPEP